MIQWVSMDAVMRGCRAALQGCVGRGSSACVTAVCVLGSGSVVLAQAPGSDRPYRALFGRGSQSGGHSLDASATLMGAYDDNVLAEGGAVSPGAGAVSGQYAMLQTGGAYAWATQRVQLGMTGASAFQYFAELSRVQSVSHSLGIGVSTTLPKRTGLSLNQAIAYSPSYLSELFAGLAEPSLGDAPPASPNYDVNDAASTSVREHGHHKPRHWQARVGQSCCGLHLHRFPRPEHRPAGRRIVWRQSRIFAQRGTALVRQYGLPLSDR